MPSFSQNSELPVDPNKTIDNFGGRGSEAFHLYIKARRAGKRADAQKILADSELTVDERIGRLRDLIRCLEF